MALPSTPTAAALWNLESVRARQTMYPRRKRAIVLPRNGSPRGVRYAQPSRKARTSPVQLQKPPTSIAGLDFNDTIVANFCRGESCCCRLINDARLRFQLACIQIQLYDEDSSTEEVSLSRVGELYADKETRRVELSAEKQRHLHCNDERDSYSKRSEVEESGYKPLLIYERARAPAEPREGP